MLPGINSNPGFQGSDHSWVQAIIYQHNDDPIVMNGKPLGFNLNGQTGDDGSPSISSVSTQKNIGSASGSFQIELKPSQSAKNLFDTVVDDDWVDIIFWKGDEGWHVMRGLLDETPRNRSVSKNGATTTTFSLTGRDFGKIWETTPIWFSPYANDIVTQAASIEIFKGVPSVYHSPGKAPYFFLKEFIEKFTSAGGVNWAPPIGMPGTKQGTFTGNVNFHESLLGSSLFFQNKPARNAFNPNGMNPQGMCWELAKEYSDEPFTELYVDLLPKGDGPLSSKLTLGDPLTPLDTEMTVVLRDKPFPVVPTSVPFGYKHPWYDIPVQMINRQEIVSDNLSRSGYERYNSFYVTPRILQEQVGSYALNMLAPLLDKESIKRHGIRRMDVQSNVTPEDLDFKVFAEYQRNVLRDWYCLNPYMLSGTIALGHGRPDLKIGNRLAIPGSFLSSNELELEESYYMESVSNTWKAGTGARTNLGVTRGWIGTDAEYIAALNKVARGYAEPPLLLSVPEV